MTNCGQANPKCSNAPKNLVILKKQIVDKRNRSEATHEKIYSFSNDNLWTSETEVQQRTKKSSHFEKKKLWTSETEMQQRTKKSSHIFK